MSTDPSDCASPAQRPTDSRWNSNPSNPFNKYTADYQFILDHAAPGDPKRANIRLLAEIMNGYFTSALLHIAWEGLYADDQLIRDCTYHFGGERYWSYRQVTRAAGMYSRISEQYSPPLDKDLVADIQIHFAAVNAAIACTGAGILMSQLADYLRKGTVALSVNDFAELMLRLDAVNTAVNLIKLRDVKEEYRIDKEGEASRGKPLRPLLEQLHADAVAVLENTLNLNAFMLKSGPDKGGIKFRELARKIADKRLAEQAEKELFPERQPRADSQKSEGDVVAPPLSRVQRQEIQGYITAHAREYDELVVSIRHYLGMLYHGKTTPANILGLAFEFHYVKPKPDLEVLQGAAKKY